MISASELQKSAPYDGGREVWVDDDNQNVAEIIQAIRKKHNLDVDWYNKHCKEFWRGNVKDTAKLLFDFHKKYIDYIIEPEKDQTVKTPGRLLHDRHGDCKHYSLFTCGIVDALTRAGYPIECNYRFVADYPELEVHHVFAVVSDPVNKKNYWVDPVLDTFNDRPTFYNTKDYGMAISSLSGTAGGTGRYNISIVAGGVGQRNPFHNRHELLAFLRKHGRHPNSFKNPMEMKVFIIDRLNHEIHSHNSKSAVGRKNKKHGNFLTKIAHGLKVNAENAAHGIAVDAANAKTMALKVSLAAGRGPFLALVDLNAFNLAHRLRDTLMIEGPERRAKLLAKWRSLGGKDSGLINAVNNGYREYKRHNGGYVISRDHVSGIGMAETTMVALASGILATLAAYFKSATPADKSAMAKSATTGTQDITAKVHKAITASPDASNSITNMATGNSGGSISANTGVSADGTPTVTVTAASHPSFDNAGQPGGPDGNYQPTPDDIPGGGPVDNAVSTMMDNGGGGKKKGKKSGAADEGSNGSGNGLTKIIDEVETFVTDHKTAVGITAGTMALGYFLMHTKKRRR